MIIKETISRDQEGKAIDTLARLSNLSKSRIKHAMNCGAVWIKRSGTRERRLRRATYRLQAGDHIGFYYDAVVLGRQAQQAMCVKDLKRYSIWDKPAGLMTQGTRYGDHCALLRQVERHFKPARRALPVHRIDREAAGLVLVAHDRQAAARLSQMFREHQIDKTYQISVRGDIRCRGASGKIDLDLDGRRALTRYRMLRHDQGRNQSHIQVSIVTGRRHQIRRHFEAIGYPVMGDPRYGTDNKNRAGLQLTATGLCFECPFGSGTIDFRRKADVIS